MSRVVEVSGEEITLEKVIDLFEIFCECFEIESTDRDIRVLRGQCFKDFKKEGTLEYRISLGTKFFIQRTGNKAVRIWVNTPSYYPADKQKENYKKAIIEYFNK